LTRRPATTLAVLSTRPLSDLEKQIGMDEVIYLANHGLEIKGPGMTFEPTLDGDKEVALKELASELTHRLARISGSVVAFKRLSLSVDYRSVPVENRELVRHVVRSAFDNLADMLLVKERKKVIEILPRIDWDMGRAVHWIREQLATPQLPALYLGSERSDGLVEALPNDITIHVGPSGETDARFFLPPPYCRAFLNWLATTS